MLQAWDADHFAVGQAGHGLNYEYDHPTTYASVLNYLVHNGLAPQESKCSSGNGGKNGGGRHHGGGRGKGWKNGPPSA